MTILCLMFYSYDFCFAICYVMETNKDVSVLIILALTLFDVVSIREHLTKRAYCLDGAVDAHEIAGLKRLDVWDCG